MSSARNRPRPDWQKGEERTGRAPKREEGGVTRPCVKGSRLWSIPRPVCGAFPSSDASGAAFCCAIMAIMCDRSLGALAPTVEPRSL